MNNRMENIEIEIEKIDNRLFDLYHDKYNSIDESEIFIISNQIFDNEKIRKILFHEIDIESFIAQI